MQNFISAYIVEFVQSIKVACWPKLFANTFFPKEHLIDHSYTDFWSNAKFSKPSSKLFPTTRRLGKSVDCKVSQKNHEFFTNHFHEKMSGENMPI